MKRVCINIFLLSAFFFLGCSPAETKAPLAVVDTVVKPKVNYTYCSSFDDGACVNKDEEVTLFNSYAYYDVSTEQWVAEIKGWIYETDYLAVERFTFVSLIEGVVGSIDEEPSFFEERISPFLADNESSEDIIVKIGNTTYPIKSSNRVGHFFDTIHISQEDVKNLREDNVLEYTIVMPEDDTRVFKGKIFLLDDNGTMVISDIDDTIKVTEVYLGNEKVIENSFLKSSKVVVGMRDLFETLENENENVSFHYVSGSPWEFYSVIEKFLNKYGFKEGTLHLKELSLNPFSSGLYDFLDKDSTYKHKVETISLMMQNFPNKKFILIGDSGEKDPEVYGYLLENYKNQIKSVYIRNVTDETLDNNRMINAFGEYAREVILIKSF